MTSALAAPSADDTVDVPAAVRTVVDQHIRAAVGAIVDSVSGRETIGTGPDPDRTRYLAALAATYSVETLISEALSGLRVELAEAAAFAGASYAHLGNAAGVNRSRAQQMWPTAGKRGKRRKWLTKHHTRVSTVLRAVVDQRDLLGPEAAHSADLAVITNAVATDTATVDVTALDQALSAATAIANRVPPPVDVTAAALRQQITALADAATADHPPAPDSTAPDLRLLRDLPQAPPAAPAWHGALPEVLTSAITDVLDLFGTPSEHSSPPRGPARPNQFDTTLTRLRRAVTDDNPDAVHRELVTLITRPVAPKPGQHPDLLDATRTLAKHAAKILLRCPTCDHEPATDDEPALHVQRERVLHLDALGQPWLGLVNDVVVERRHCPRCQPCGYDGIDLACPGCDQGYLLEPALAAHRADLPPPVRRFLADQGWDAITTSTHPVHVGCVKDPAPATP